MHYINHRKGVLAASFFLSGAGARAASTCCGSRTQVRNEYGADAGFVFETEAFKVVLDRTYMLYCMINIYSYYRYTFSYFPSSLLLVLKISLWFPHLLIAVKRTFSQKKMLRLLL
jgi:hypothetical protein